MSDQPRNSEVVGVMPTHGSHAQPKRTSVKQLKEIIDTTKTINAELSVENYRLRLKIQDLNYTIKLADKMAAAFYTADDHAAFINVWDEYREYRKNNA